MIRNATLLSLTACVPTQIQLKSEEDTGWGLDSGETAGETGDQDGTGWEDTGGDETGLIPDDTDTETGWETGAETGVVDTGTPCTETVWYADMDGDGYGQVSLYEWECTQPTGYVSQAGDSDDADPTVHWSPCQQTLVDIGLEGILRTESWDDLSLAVELSSANQFVSVHWYDSAAPSGVWLACATVSGLSGPISVSSDTAVSSYYANTYTEENTGAAEDWNQYLVTGATRSDGTSFEVSAYGTEAELTAIP